MPSKLLEGGSRSVLVFALCSISFMSECDLCHDPDDPRSLDVVSLPTSLTFSEVELDPPPPLKRKLFITPRHVLCCLHSSTLLSLFPAVVPLSQMIWYFLNVSLAVSCCGANTLP